MRTTWPGPALGAIAMLCLLVAFVDNAEDLYIALVGAVFGAQVTIAIYLYRSARR